MAININVNIEALRTRIMRALQKSMQRIALGLEGVKALPDGPLFPDDIFFTMTFNAHPVKSLESHGEFNSWLIGAGLCDMIEALDSALTEMYAVACVSANMTESLKGLTSSEGAGIVQRQMEKDSIRFDRLKFPQKLAALVDEHGFKLMYEDEAKSIQKTRNCFTHRGGVAGIRDTADRENASLALRYRRLDLVAVGPDGTEASLAKDSFVAKGHGVSVRSHVKDEKRFSIGERVISLRTRVPLGSIHALGIR